MKQFKTESKRMMDLMINSIYTNREIFLREILSNSSDAIDKRYYKGFESGATGLSRSDFYIRIAANEAERTITITDNGIGMTADELENNLGTIAKSGSREFKQNAENDDKKGDIDIIGQFGVGFYSAFMVAKRVEVLSRGLGEEKANLWTSSGADGYEIQAAQRDEVGTTITIYLKDNEGEDKYDEFLKEYKLRELVKKYSDYVRYPIIMNVEKHIPDETADGEEKKDEEPKMKTVFEDETLNSMTPIWLRNRADVKDEDYEEFYSKEFYDYEKPLKIITAAVEGVVDYKALLFIPKAMPYGYYTKNYEKGLKLYTSSVLITDKCADLLPDYFSFVKGVVDSQLTLNISRETVQQNRQLKAIAKNLEKKISQELKSMLETDRTNYNLFFDNFGLALKFGIYSSYGMNSEALKDFIMFKSAKSGEYVTLKEYVGAMAEGQKYIIYATGKSVDGIKALPRIDAVLDKGYDVLCCTEDVDEFAIKMLRAYDEKEFRSAESGDLEIGTEEAAIDETLSKRIMERLSGKIVKVKGTKSLKNHPVCLSSEGDISIEMEKVFAKMPDGSEGAKANKVLEINVDHAVYSKLLSVLDDEEKSNKIIDVLYQQSRLIAGLNVDDAIALTDAIFDLI